MAQVNLGHVVGPGVPTGGAANQVLVKNGATNFDTSWKDASQLPAIGDEETAREAADAALADGLAIIANGDTHAAVAAGQAVFVRSHSTLAPGLYWASSAIGTNAALSTSNLTADNQGGLNKLKGDIDSLNSNIANVNNRFSWRTIYANSTYINDVGRTLTLTSSLQNVRQLMIIGYIGSISSANRVIFIIPVDGSISASYYLTSYAGIIKSARIEGSLSSLHIISFSDNNELFINEIKAIG